MEAKELASKYATAVFSLALEEWVAAITSVHNSIQDDPELLDTLKAPDQPFNVKQVVLDGMIPTDCSQPVRNFLYTLLKEDKMEILPDILQNMERLSKGTPQMQVAYVVTATSLDEGEKEKFRQKLRSQYGESLDLEFNVNPEIIGGAIVRIGDKLIDGSVATRLSAMGNALGVRV